MNFKSEGSNNFSIEGLDYRTASPIRITVQNGRIVNVQTLKSVSSSLWIGPGLVDLQVNGFNGCDFNTYPNKPIKVYEVTKALWAHGVTGYFPTIVTNSDEAIESAISSVAEALQQYPDIRQTIRGIHLEGPFISSLEGPRGAHDVRYVKAPDWELFQKWQELANGLIRLITLSPEWEGAVDFIRRCTRSGVKVAIGHTAATTKEIFDAVNAGASLSTHLGNGAHPLLPRHPNYIWDQLANDDLYTSFIADGFHLPLSVMQVILKVKQDKAMLISDSVWLAGMESGSYNTHIGGRVVLTPDGKLHLAQHPDLLAGSVQPLIQGIDHLVRTGLCDLRQAWEMGSIGPSKFMEFVTPLGFFLGAPADLVIFSRESQQTRIVRVFNGGSQVYENLQG
ncbi:N-acetylglucosamine-6-phosphate deacetylase [Alicyclobacillus fastidiosus]|uniref:N-acetylglucosamine-6-phosphate deacetylase n=1 Tax=Alicyclobacillus fastidiosus TaxID=392011 RepID=A0ABY6ZDH1_9BACL|nr:N-acetylglucosamine-6-phosphate deacetylase [Alicyclobacillus fastidiosus]WAH40608.1 N-acetylglucosamine-6-phosphate deacetylase [Alicyclobacillus fastidiosus]GMA62048.1 N-acetylglucosamine-6-phosphate deacetylase [Alicyclobacillus fastidiosus]